MLIKFAVKSYLFQDIFRDYRNEILFLTLMISFLKSVLLEQRKRLGVSIKRSFKEFFLFPRPRVEKVTKNVEMLVVLTFMAACCLNYNAFGTASSEEGAEQEHKKAAPEVILQKIGTYLRKEVVSTVPLLLKGARETLAKNFFTLNMEHIKEENMANLAELLFDTRDVRNLKIRKLKWKIFKSALAMKPNLKFNNLEKLDLSNNDIDDGKILGINELLFSRTPKLTNIDLSDNRIGARGAAAISHMNNLITLSLSWNQIGDVGALAIAESSHMNSLQSLSLCGNQIKDDGAIAIVQSQHMNSLIIFHLWGNQIEEGVRVRLREVYCNCKVE
jgi:hypothetical protein